jgi:hypothetical protein
MPHGRRELDRVRARPEPLASPVAGQDVELLAQRGGVVACEQTRLYEEQRELARRGWIREAQRLDLRELHASVAIDIEAREAARELVVVKGGSAGCSGRQRGCTAEEPRCSERRHGERVSAGGEAPSSRVREQGLFAGEASRAELEAVLPARTVR